MEGRFVSKDPLGFKGGDENLYAYVDSVGKPPVPQTNLYRDTENNPIIFTDPIGLYSVRSGVIYDDNGNPIGETGLEDSSFLADPINWIRTGAAIKGKNTPIFTSISKCILDHLGITELLAGGATIAAIEMADCTEIKPRGGISGGGNSFDYQAISMDTPISPK